MATQNFKRNLFLNLYREGEKIFLANGDQKKAGVAMLISDKIDFEIKAGKR